MDNTGKNMKEILKKVYYLAEIIYVFLRERFKFCVNRKN